MMRPVLLVGLTLCLTAMPTVAAQDQDQAPAPSDEVIDILKKVDAAAKAVKAVSYHGRIEEAGRFCSTLSLVEGDVLMVGDGVRPQPSKCRVASRTKLVGSDQVREMTIAYDGETVWVLDATDKKAYQSTEPDVLGPVGKSALAWLMMIEFVHPTPFSDEINAEKAELKGETKVGDEECYHIHVKYRDARGLESAWYVSKKDYLPRRVDRLRPTLEGDMSVRTLIVTDLVVDPELTDGSFKLVVPEGFEMAEGPSF